MANETEERLGKKRIKELPETTTANDSDIIIIENLDVTHKMKNENYIRYIKEHPDINKYFVHEEHKGQENGVAPLNTNKKIEPEFLTFGKAADSVYEGSEGKKIEDAVSAHKSDTGNPHRVTQAQIGLPNAENKSSATIRAELTYQNVVEALGFKPETDGAYENATKYADQRISELLGGASENLDTLKEIEDKLGENDDAVASMIATLAAKASKDELDTHVRNDTIHTNATERQQSQAAYAHSQAAHARVDATKVSISDENGTILINGSEAMVYQHPLSGTAPGTYTSVTVDNQGHITGGTNPVVPISQGGTGAVTAKDALISLGLTAAASEINTLDGMTASTIELNRLSGLTGNVQTQLNDKADKNHTHNYIAGIQKNGTDLPVDASTRKVNVAIPSKLSELENDVGYQTGGTDTKNTAGSTNSTSKLFLVGAISQGANPQTYSNANVFIGTDGCLYSNGTKASVDGHTHSNYASAISTTGSGNAVTAIAQSGNTVTVTKGSTFLTAHPSITLSTNTTSSASPAFGSTFTAIDSITKDSYGHVTKINTKTVTIPKPSGVTVSQATEPTSLSAGDFWEAEY